jgi:hypothetical protein
MSITDTFDPDRNGWIFENWGETSELSWDLFRRTYIGINPTHDCVEAPLDCAFYEIFKNCAAGGNCGGMSLLALAMFKHGGWMGFCGPANFYSGVNQPDRTDLYEAINILQSRQFSASGIENFMDVVDSGNLNNAISAYNIAPSGGGLYHFGRREQTDGGRDDEQDQKREDRRRNDDRRRDTHQYQEHRT